MNITTLNELLRRNMNINHTGITFIESSDQEIFLSYADLYQEAVNALAILQAAGMQQGDELVLQIVENKNFLIGFWAALLGGFIPVPLAAAQNAVQMQKVFKVWEILHRPFLLIAGTEMKALESFATADNQLPRFLEMQEYVIFEEKLRLSESEGKLAIVEAKDIAFVQFSSGSTGLPKGVMLTHENLMANMNGIANAGNYGNNDRLLSWMPLTHDMGMIGFHLNPLYSGINQYLMPTSLFVRRPSLWLSKATEHNITVLCSPNFGYDYLLRHLSALGEQNWNLSQVRIIYNGAEPISPALCIRFIENLAAYGLSRAAMCPVYGLAEASVAVAMSAIDLELKVIQLHRDQLNQGNVIQITHETENTVSFVNVGKAVEHCLLRVANDDDEPVPEATIGQVHIKGKNVTAGYYNNENESSAAITNDGWLRTGDLGFLLDGSLYITGRKKDIFFVNGQNYYPHDIERIAEESAGFGLNKIAIAGWFNNIKQQEEVIAFVAHRGNIDAFVPLVKQLKAVINTRTGLLINRVIPIKQIPKTTSGKLQRFKLIEHLRNGDFEKIEQELNQAIINTVSHFSDDVLQYTPEEKKLLILYKEVLDRQDIGVNDSFFEVGGNSLKSAELAMLMLKYFEIELSLKTLYNKPTVRMLAAVINQLKKQEYRPLERKVKQEFYPVGFAQRRLYYAWEIDNQSTAYNVPICIQIKGGVNATKLADCIRQMINRHEVLRMSFRREEEPVFSIADAVEFDLEFLNSTTESLDDLLLQQVKPFDLKAGKLFRMTLIKIDVAAYILFVDFHHIIADGISAGIFIKELFELYSGKELVNLPVNYSDFTCWEKTDPGSINDLASLYWTQQLQTPLSVLELPTSRKRLSTLDTRGLRKSFQFDEVTTTGLQTLAQQHGCTLHVLMLTLYYILLYKYSGNEDLIVGVAVSGRKHPDIRGLMGMFVNNLAIREQVNGKQKFLDLLKHVDQTMDDAFEYQDYPFDALVKLADARQEAGRNPLFDTMFLFQHFQMPETATTDLECNVYPFHAFSARFDLTLEIKIKGRELQYEFEYARVLFDEDFIENMGHSFTCLAQHVLADPNQEIAALPVLDTNQQDEIINLFNDTNRTFPKGKTIHHLFEEQVQRSPDAIALEFNGHKVSYEHLNRQADEMALLLRGKGVRNGSIIGILLPRNVSLVVSILAVLKAGGAYLPMDTELPEARIRFMIEDSKTLHLITTSSIAETRQLNQIPGLRILYTDATETLYESASPTETEDIALGDRLAYIIYTSGTTGNPKGVMVYHASLVNYITWAAATYVKEKGITFPLFTSISFDLTVTTIFTPLVTGNRVLIYDEANGEVLIEKIVSDNFSDIIKLTPSHLRVIAAGKFMPRGKSRVKRFIVGGEQLNTTLSKTICDQFGSSVEIYNEYGPTEATVGCMIHLFNQNETSEVVPIGVPAPNTQVYLLDQYLQPVPSGVLGEIYISGDALAKGYLFNPVLTAEKFISNPFVQDMLMYKTGDTARRLKNGIIEYTGRQDQQVKINGYRIELQEIENNMIGYQGISGAVAAIKQLENGTQLLCAYYTGGADVSADGLHDYLAAHLPHYMLPVHFIALDHIPLTQNAKTDYAALPDPSLNVPAHPIMPADETEQTMLQVWGDVLGLSGITVSDNFFQLGGDSIKAVQITSRLLEKGIEIKVKDILTRYTIAQISRHATFNMQRKSYAQGIISGAKPLSPIEQWFFAQRLKNPDYYNQSALIFLKKPLPDSLLADAFERIIETHDELRINYDAAKQQTFYNEAHLGKRLVIETHQALSGDISGICEALRQKSDVENDFLLRVARIQTMQGQNYLFITAHHLVTDGISWRILVEDLYTCCKALENEMQVTLPQKTASLIEWQQALEAYAASGDYMRAEAFWAKQKAGTFSLPVEKDTEDLRSRHREKIQLQLDETETSFLVKEANLVYQTNTSILLNAALAMALKTWTGAEYITIEQENHGRHLDINVSRTMGWFTVIYPLTFALADNRPETSIRAVKAAFDVLPDHGMGYRIYLEKHAANQHSGITPVRLNYLGQFDHEFDNDLFKFSNQFTGAETDPENNLSALLEINSMVVHGRLQIEFGYSSKSFSEGTMQWLANLFMQQLDHLQDHLLDECNVNAMQDPFGATLDEQDLNELFND
ncbi:amino acid adenylation domain-containing protein [Pedobacter sp. PF22-3]|uniref:non-ribosomal peptide synthetase n=1 Tax=Pedobacter sp. PF22-3 TaxID=2994467 RepID=UPI002246E1FC|nr:non-ribosomal peptide synthetase [Pedobacter sp. PF22-3]MCX2492854.1 amino acid adenylation domain-containing protein [Pedobacter sp. PF22-3]